MRHLVMTRARRPDLLIALFHIAESLVLINIGEVSVLWWTKFEAVLVRDAAHLLIIRCAANIQVQLAVFHSILFK